MKFTELPVADHDLVVLRPMVDADLAPWFAYLSQPSVYEHTSWNVQASAELAPYVWHPEAFTDASMLRFAIALRTSGEFVGTAGFHTVSPPNRSAEMAYDLAPQVWGRGIATSVCTTLTAWAHQHVGLVRVQASVLETNHRSAAVLERCGFEREGLLRAYRLVRGVPGNFWMYAHVVAPPAGAAQVRHQYHSRPSAHGLLTWDVRRLIALSASLPVHEIPIGSISELDEPHWYARAALPTCRSVAGHAALIAAADLRYPIILDASGRVMDGMHRVCQALMQGRATIRAVRFEADPEPDFVGRDPDTLPYDDDA